MNTPSVRWVPVAPTASVASARLRCYRPADALARAGWDSAILRRRLVTRPDVVVFQKAYGDREIQLAGRLRRRGVAIVFDLCDNHFYAATHHENGHDRLRRLHQMIRTADVVTTSTPTLARLVEHPRVVVVDDAVDATAGIRIPSPGVGRRLVWFGNAGSEAESYGMADLGEIVDDLRSVARRLSFDLTVVSNSYAAFERYVGRSGLNAQYYPWTQAAAARELRKADIALLPVTTNPFTECKSGNRVITSLIYGLASVVGTIPSYEEFAPYVRFEHWQDNVGEYITDSRKRVGDVTAGQAYIARRFSPDHLLNQWAGALRSAVALRHGSTAA